MHIETPEATLTKSLYGPSVEVRRHGFSGAFGERSALLVLAPTLPNDASPFHLALKRVVDVVVAAGLLLVILPLLLLTAAGVRRSSPGPIFFRQTRIGRDGRPFTMLKFRTFPVDHVDDTLAPTIDACPLRFGRFLRRTSIDELPQLLNVMTGDMALVGPRPERPQFAGPLARKHPAYRERHRMPAGITGLAQVSGLVGTTSIAHRVAADNAYIDGWSIGRDFHILLKTVPALLRKLRW